MEGFVQTYSEQALGNTDDHVDIKLWHSKNLGKQQPRQLSGSCGPHETTEERGILFFLLWNIKPRLRDADPGLCHHHCSDKSHWSKGSQGQAAMCVYPSPGIHMTKTQSGALFDGSVEFSFSPLQRDTFIVLVLSKVQKDGTS